MANIHSAKKRIRTNARKHMRNTMYRSRAKTMIKRAEAEIFNGTPDAEAVRQACRTLDKAAGKGILHKNNAARRKARLMKKYNEALQETTTA